MSHLTKSNDSDSGCLWATRYQNCSSGKTHSKERGSTEAEQGKEPSWTSGVKPRTASCQQTADPDNKPGQDGHSPDQGTFFFPSRVFGPVHAAPEFPCPACCCAPWPSAAPSCLDTAHGLVTSSNTASALHLHQARSGATTWISESALPLCIGVWQQSADRCMWEHSSLTQTEVYDSGDPGLIPALPSCATFTAGAHQSWVQIPQPSATHTSYALFQVTARISSMDRPGVCPQNVFQSKSVWKKFPYEWKLAA